MLRIFLVALLVLTAGSVPACADPISALIIGAIGLTGTAAAVGTAALDIAIGIGLSYAAQKLAPKPKAVGSAVSSEQSGRTLSLSLDTNAPRQAIFGRAATAGSLVYWQTTGSNNMVLQLVVALADHECQGLAGLWVDGKECDWNSGTKQIEGYGANLKVRFYSGAAGQTVDTAVRDASGGAWTDDEVGSHVCYAVVEATYNETLFQGGIPQIIFVVDGAKLYDPRFDDTAGGDGDQRWNDQSTWAFSRNAAVATYNVLRGFSAGGKPLLGLNAPADAIRAADFEAAANICDEDVSLAAGGTEPRYRADLVVTLSGQPNRETLDALILSMAGDVICCAGIYRIIAGAARTSVATISDADIIITEPFTSEPRLSRAELTNAVIGSFSDPDRSYNTVPLPPRTSSEDETADGGIRLAQTLDLVAVTSRTQGQRVMEMVRKRARRQLRVSVTLRARFFLLEVGDWITFNSDRRGYSSKVFEIEGLKRNPDLTVSLLLREMDSGVDDWTTLDELADDTSNDLPAGGPTLTSVSGLEVEAALISGNGVAQMPGLRATWTPITDPTVIALRIEYRKVGDTVAQEKRVENASTGQHTWTEGIQGSLDYEIRALPVTMPERQVDWTAWVQTADVTDPLTVDVATEVPPDTITKEMLDPQAREELRLVTAVDGTLGSLPAALDEVFRQLALTSEHAIRGMVGVRQAEVAIRVEQTQRITDKQAFAQQITTLQAAFENTAALIQVEQTVRAEADGSLSEQITTVSGAVAAQTASVVVIQEVIDGIQSRFGVAVNNNGQVIGLIALDGSPQGSTFTVVADKFLVALPNVTGGDAVPVFAIQNVNGSAKLALRGDMIADGSILARHIQAVTLSAISADIGEVTAGIMRSADNKMRLDFNGKSFRMDL
jgi:hypothetical protein